MDRKNFYRQQRDNRTVLTVIESEKSSSETKKSKRRHYPNDSKSTVEKWALIDHLLVRRKTKLLSNEFLDTLYTSTMNRGKWVFANPFNVRINYRNPNERKFSPSPQTGDGDDHKVNVGFFQVILLVGSGYLSSCLQFNVLWTYA